MDLTPDQIQKLNSLGIVTEKTKTENLDIGNLKLEIKRPKSNIFPLLSISGLTILSFGGLVLLKGKGQTANSVPSTINNLPPNSSLTPTQVPKSIQHYLLTSQQYFTQALQSQKDQQSTIDLLNKSILAATDSIKEFPQDYRGYQQRGRIYQSLIDSKPELLTQSIADFTVAQKLNPNSSEITYTLASLYAKKGDAQNTIIYLNQTVALEPTKAQTFYDLAKIQQQVGLLPQSLDTYNKLITLVTDPAQKNQIELEKSSIEKIIAQNPSAYKNQPTIDNLSPTISPIIDSPTIQALASGGLIIAAPEENNKIEVSNLTDSNSLSGNSILPLGQKEISISNTLLTPTSQVYVTATKGGKNQNLQVLSKFDKSFTVGLSSPINEPVEFKWWIIN